MSIAKLKRVTVCGALADKRDILAGLQRLGCLHLLPLTPPPSEVEKAAPEHAENARKALRFLTDVPDRRRQVMHDPSFHVESLVEQVLDLKQRLRDAGDRRDFLSNRIEEVEPWGDIDFPPHEALAGYRLWFYRLHLKNLKSLGAIDHPWTVVRRDHRYAYLIVLARDEPPRDLLPVPRTQVGALPRSASPASSTSCAPTWRRRKTMPPWPTPPSRRSMTTPSWPSRAGRRKARSTRSRPSPTKTGWPACSRPRRRTKPRRP